MKSNNVFKKYLEKEKNPDFIILTTTLIMSLKKVLKRKKNPVFITLTTTLCLFS